ncbi:MAG: carbohydrate kinase [Nitratireductor sp.]
MIICCGEALIDMLPRELPDGSPVFMPVAGGAVFNTAIALGRLGEETGFFSGVSTDVLGQTLIRALEASKVDHSPCSRSARPTTLAFVTLKDGHAEYAFYDEMTAGRMLDPKALPSIAPNVLAMHFGAISLISEPCGSAYEALALREARNRVISLDPNIRPGFVSDERAYRARLDRMLKVADIIKVSDDDLAWLSPGQDFASWAGTWLSASASIVVLTRGGEGAIALTRAGEVHASAVATTVVDTVGAGDTFNAGLLAGIRRAGALSREGLASLSHDALHEALNLAARAAAVTVSRAGANPPWADEI